MAGGYLVLERPNAGLVLSTNARFYAIVKPIYEEIKHDSWAWVRGSFIIIPYKTCFLILQTSAMFTEFCFGCCMLLMICLLFCS